MSRKTRRESIEEEHPTRKVTLTGALQVLSLVGLVVFAAVRIAYDVFYRRLGIEPSDVGITYSDTLQRASVGLAVILVSLITYAAIHAAVGFAIDLLFAGGSKAYHGLRGSESSSDRKIGKDFPGGTVRWAAVVFVALLFALLPYVSVQLSDDVKNGSPVLPKPFDFDNPLGLRAERVDVQWLGEADDDLAPGPILYLGQANGVTVFIRPESDEIVRVPSGSVVIRSVTSDAESLSDR